ncbi:cytochrome P450 [Mycena epipterygia]|nr:cytochrome P450 [Mycena epipterygia]
MADNPHLAQQWRDRFGPNFRFKGLFGISELHTSNIKALNHIVTNSAIYQKPPTTLANAQRLAFSESNWMTINAKDESLQAPAFGVPQIRLVTEVFVEKAVQVCTRGRPRENTVEVLSWLRRMALDVIGEAGFDYPFDALATKGKKNELDQVFTQLFHSPHVNRNAAFRLSQTIFLILKLLLVSESKANIKATDGDKALSSRRDLLSVLLKANLATDTPQRLTDAEVIAQIPTFFVAGHVLFIVALLFGTDVVTLNPAVQSKLREELLTISTDNPTMDELNSLPYLEMVGFLLLFQRITQLSVQVVRETMRVYCPVVFISRMAMQDDVLPLAKPYIDKLKAGKSHDSLLIPKGQMIHIPILAVNRDKEIWGKTRTSSSPSAGKSYRTPSALSPAYGRTKLLFFAGPHNCIGFRFALAEMKALLFTVVRAFEFKPAVPEGGIGSSGAGFLQRPMVLAHKEEGTGLPLILKPFNAQGY